MTSIVITPFNDEHAEELMGFIQNELDNADFEGEDMPAAIRLQDVDHELHLLTWKNKLMLDALDTIASGNTDPNRMVELAQQALTTLQGETA